MSGHTATPWRNACFQVYGADNSRIAHTGMGQLPPSRAPESEANAAFIVTACNSHAELVKALEIARARIEYLGAACSNPKHFEANANEFLPAIDAALATLTARKVG